MASVFTSPMFLYFSTWPSSYLFAQENKPLLQKILTYHVASGSVRSSDLYQGERIATLEGQAVVVTTYNQQQVIFNNNSKVIQANVVCSNGIVRKLPAVSAREKEDDIVYQYPFPWLPFPGSWSLVTTRCCRSRAAAQQPPGLQSVPGVKDLGRGGVVIQSKLLLIPLFSLLLQRTRM